MDRQRSDNAVKLSGFRPRKEDVILFLLLLIPFLSFYYSDLNSNIRQGMNVWEALIQGRFFEYYGLNVESRDAGQMIHVANYDMLLNIAYGIWQLPLFIIEKITGGNILDHFAARLYGKSIHFIAMYTAAEILYRIGRVAGLKDERNRQLKFMFLSSIFTICVALNASQVDIIGLNLILLATLFILKEEWGKFIVSFILAVQFKEFAWLIFLPVILAKEKNLIKSGAMLVSPFVLNFIVSLPFKLADPVGVASRRPRTWIQMDFLTRSRITLGEGFEVPLLFIALGAIVFWAYFRMKEKESERDIFFMQLLSMTAVLLFTRTAPYWAVYITPFYLLLMLMDGDRLFIRIVMEMAGTFSVMVTYFIVLWGPFDCMEGMLPDMLIKKEFVDPGLFTAWISDEKYFYFWTLSFAAFAVWLVYSMYRNRPGAERTAAPVQEENAFWTHGTDKSINMLLWLRALAAFFFSTVMIWVNLVLAL